MTAAPDLPHAALAFAAAFGTLITFAALIWLGLDSVTANATSTVAVCAGTIASGFAFRRELRTTEPRFLAMIVPSLLGGLAGALLLRHTPSAVFDRVVPLLILFATLLFLGQGPVQRAFKTAGAASGPRGARWFVGGLLFQLLVGLYGGYFGAGIGILMLAAFSILGLEDIHQMLALKAIFAAVVNGVAALYFIWARMVYWPYVLVMMLAAILGGWGGAGTARKLGRDAVRRMVIAVGFAMAAWLAIKSW